MTDEYGAFLEPWQIKVKQITWRKISPVVLWWLQILDQLLRDQTLARTTRQQQITHSSSSTYYTQHHLKLMEVAACQEDSYI